MWAEPLEELSFQVQLEVDDSDGCAATASAAVASAAMSGLERRLSSSATIHGPSSLDLQLLEEPPLDIGIEQESESV